MTVNDVTLYKHRVTALKIFGHARLLTDLGKLVGRFDVNCEAVFPQVGCIAFTATALRALVKSCTSRCCHDRQRQDRSPKGGALTKGPSVHVRSPSTDTDQLTRSTVIIPETWWSVTWQ